MRCGDLLSKALMSWMTQGGTELGSGASSAPLCDASLRQPENCGQQEDRPGSGPTASLERGAVVATAGTLLGHVPPGDLVHTSINTGEHPPCQSFFYIWGILKEARAEGSNKRNRTAHEKSLALIWNIPQTPRDNGGEVELEG